MILQRLTRIKSQRGSALILVLWAIVIMGIAVLGMINILQTSLEISSHRQLDLEAECLARSGVSLAENPLVKRNDDLLSQTLETDHSFKVKISSEGARLNLNYLMAHKDRRILSNLFTNWGLNADQCDRVIDCLSDWVSPNTTDIHSLNGATDADYVSAGLPAPAHRPFRSLEEVEDVLNFNLVVAKRPNWKESFTLWSAGQLNVNEAPAELIDAVFQAGLPACENFVETRNGPDHLVGTDDDVTVQDLPGLQAILGMSAENAQVAADQISFGDPTRRIESTGRAQGRKVRISAVIRVGTFPIEILSWSQQ